MLSELQTDSLARFKMPKTPRVLDLPYPERRLIAIGDIHGCLDEFAQLWTKLKPDKGDCVVFLGDLVDRGPCSADVLHLVHYLCTKEGLGDLLEDCLCVIGNHDEKAVRHRYHEVKRGFSPDYKNPMRVGSPRLTEYAEMRDDALTWMAGNPHIIRFHDPTGSRLDTWCTHAGLLPWADPLRQPTSGLIRNRWVDVNHQPVALGPNLAQPERAVGWETLWDGRARVIYGHNVHSLTVPRIVNNTYGIDTGCCFGGELTAFLDEGGSTRFEQVKAARDYTKDLPIPE